MEDGGSGANEAGFGGGEVDLAATAHGWFSGPVDRLDRPVHMLFPFSFFFYFIYCGGQLVRLGKLFDLP